MGYALFAQRKLVLDSQLNAAQLQQTQRSNEQYQLATKTLSLQQQLSSLQAAQAFELQPMYQELSNAGNNLDQDKYKNADGTLSDNYYKEIEQKRADINAKILSKQEKFKVEEDQINQQIYIVGVKENAIEMEVKRLDTQVTALQKQLEATEEAEGAAIDRANPKFKGVG